MVLSCTTRGDCATFNEIRRNVCSSHLLLHHHHHHHHLLLLLTRSLVVEELYSCIIHTDVRAEHLQNSEDEYTGGVPRTSKQLRNLTLNLLTDLGHFTKIHFGVVQPKIYPDATKR